MNCKLCGRSLDQPDDPLSTDCGGDCWGCIGEIEAELEALPSMSPETASPPDPAMNAKAGGDGRAG